jgi:hypothetical protein
LYPTRCRAPAERCNQAEHLPDAIRTQYTGNGVQYRLAFRRLGSDRSAILPLMTGPIAVTLSEAINEQPANAVRAG